VQPIRPVASDGSTDQAKPLLIFARVCSQKDFPTSWYVTRWWTINVQAICCHAGWLVYVRSYRISFSGLRQVKRSC
jgi:hypothetical protein